MIIADADEAIADGVLRLLRTPGRPPAAGRRGACLRRGRVLLAADGRDRRERARAAHGEPPATAPTRHLATAGDDRRDGAVMSRAAFTVALVGRDGAGKTTVARRLEGEIDRPIRYLYMGVSADSSNRSLPTTRLAHRIKRAAGAPPDTARPARDAPRRRARRPGAQEPVQAGAQERALDAAPDQPAGRGVVPPAAGHGARAARGAIVIFDRHFVADYHAYDMSGQARTLSRRLHGWLLSHAYPQARPGDLPRRPARGALRAQGRGDAAVAGPPARGVPAARRGGRALRDRLGRAAARRRRRRGRRPVRVRRRPPGRARRARAA